MSEAEEIDRLIGECSAAYGNWCAELTNAALFRKTMETEQALRDKIQSIITERDALRKAAQSHRGKE